MIFSKVENHKYSVFARYLKVETFLDVISKQKTELNTDKKTTEKKSEKNLENIGDGI